MQFYIVYSFLLKKLQLCVLDDILASGVYLISTFNNLYMVEFIRAN